MDYEQFYNDFISSLEGKIQLVEIRLVADSNRFEKTLLNGIKLQENYISYLNEYGLNTRYPQIPMNLKSNNEYHAKALNEGKELLESLQKFYESKQVEFNLL